MPDRLLEAKGLIMCISGPSGVGKGTVIDSLIKRNPELQLSVSMTTRAPRGAELDGREYYFRSREQFEELLQKQEILEFDIYCNHYYGTPASPIREHVRNGASVVLDITIAGSFQVKKIFPDAIMVFLLPPSLEVLRERLIGRGTEEDDAVNRRIQQAEIELAYADRFEYVVINDTIENSVQRLEAIMLAESCRTERQLFEQTIPETLMT